MTRCADSPAGPPPWNGQGPERGSLDPADAEAITELLGPHTSAPDRCLFCMWDGWGWDTAMYAALVEQKRLHLIRERPARRQQFDVGRLPGLLAEV